MDELNLDEDIRLLIIYDLIRISERNIRNKIGITKKRVIEEISSLYLDFPQLKRIRFFNKEIWDYADKKNLIKFTQVSLYRHKRPHASYQHLDFITEDRTIFNRIIDFSQIRMLRKNGRSRGEKNIKFKELLEKHCNKYPEHCNEKFICKMINITPNSWYVLKSQFMGLIDMDMKKKDLKQQNKEIKKDNGKLARMFLDEREKCQIQENKIQSLQIKNIYLEEQLKNERSMHEQEVQLGYRN